MAIPAEYLQLFLADAREQLQRLGLAVVCVEEHPDDRDTVDEIFRIAHSLKASSATLGFSGMAALAHQMEDVFELLRQRTDGLPREAIDALLECLDALDACVSAIAATGAEEIDPEPLVDRLRGLVRARSAAQKASREVPEARPAPVAAALADGQSRRSPGRASLRRRRDALGARVHGALDARRARRRCSARCRRWTRSRASTTT